MKKLFLALFLVAGLAFSQVPTAQPQPTDPTYNTSVLTLLPEYTRASFEATFGVQPAAYDATRPPKTWFDSTKKCDNNSSTYQQLDPKQSAGGFAPFTEDNCQASTVNLKGLQHFAAYVNPVITSNVTTRCSFTGCIATPLAVGLQSSLAMAQAMLAEIGDPTLKIVNNVPAPPGSLFSYSIINPSSDVSVYYIGQMNVGIYWPARQSQGVGYPGKWVKTGAAVYAFTPAPAPVDGSLDTRPNVPVPVRLLLPNEKFVTNLVGGLGFSNLMIQRTDVAQPATAAGAPGGVSTGGGFTDADRASLQQVLQLLKTALGQ